MDRSLRHREILRQAALARINRLTAVAGARMMAADPALRGLRPSEVEWMDAGELEQMQHAVMLLMRTASTRDEIRARVQAKRAARVRALAQNCDSGAPL